MPGTSSVWGKHPLALSLTVRSGEHSLPLDPVLFEGDRLLLPSLPCGFSTGSLLYPCSAPVLGDWDGLETWTQKGQEAGRPGLTWDQKAQSPILDGGTSREADVPQGFRDVALRCRPLSCAWAENTTPQPPQMLRTSEA